MRLAVCGFRSRINPLGLRYGYRIAPAVRVRRWHASVAPLVWSALGASRGLNETNAHVLSVGGGGDT